MLTHYTVLYYHAYALYSTLPSCLRTIQYFTIMLTHYTVLYYHAYALYSTLVVYCNSKFRIETLAAQVLTAVPTKQTFIVMMLDVYTGLHAVGVYIVL